MNPRKNLGITRSLIHGAKFYKHFALSAFLLIGLALSVNAITLSQSSSNTIAAANTVACTNQTTGATTQNSYWRAYSLASLGTNGTFSVSSVTFGIETANAAGTGTTQPATVNIYTNTGAAFPGGTRTLVGTATTNIPDQTLSLYTVPITAAVPIGSTTRLIVELRIPDGTAAGHIFFPGSNTAAETGPSYLSAPSCGVATPTTYAAIGFPNVRLVLNVTGDVIGATAAELSISGRVVTADGSGLMNARVTLTDSIGNARTILTRKMGAFRFDDVNAGEVYIITISSRRYTFQPQVISPTENLTEINFTAQESAVLF